MRGELQARLDRRAHDRFEPYFRNEEHAAILWIRDGINIAHAPWLAHIRAAREHPTIQKHLHSDDPQHFVMGSGQRMRSDALNVLDDIRQWSQRTQFV